MPRRYTRCWLSEEIEIVIINDGSTDRTAEIARGTAAEGRMRVVDVPAAAPRLGVALRAVALRLFAYLMFVLQLVTALSCVKTERYEAP